LYAYDLPLGDLHELPLLAGSGRTASRSTAFKCGAGWSGGAA